MLSVCLGLAVLAAPASAAQALSRGQDRQDVISTVIRFADAMEKGSRGRGELLGLIWAANRSLSQDLGRVSFVRMVMAGRKLEESATKRFGDAGRRFRAGFDLVLNQQQRRAMLNEARVTIYEDGLVAAEVHTGRAVMPIVLRYVGDYSRRAGNWQVVLEFIDLEMEDTLNLDNDAIPSALTNIRLDRYDGIATSMEQVAAAIDSGELTSAAAADAELTRRLRKVNEDAIKKRIDLGEERRWP
jgi:hypothetical protein